MNPLNDELQSQVDALAKLCCETLRREQVDVEERAEPLLSALVTGGYHRLSNINLQARVEARIVEECAEPAIHRRREMTGLTAKLQASFNRKVQWETNKPHDASEADVPRGSASTRSADSP